MLSRVAKVAILAIAIIIPLASLLIWNSDQNKDVLGFESDQKIVLTSFYPLYEFTKEIGKERVEVFSIVPFGIESHDWEPSVQDIQKIQQADLVVVNGAGFETWLDDLISAGSKAVIVDTSSAILLQSTLDRNEDDHHATSKDPHIWLNPNFAKMQVKTIALNLKTIDPENAGYYEKNANDYITKLSKLDEKIRTEISQCDRKDFLAFHNAFFYFANEYGLTQHTIISGKDQHEEVTPQTLEKIIQDSKTLGFGVVFTEGAIDSRLSKVIADEIGARVLVLDPIEIGDESTSYIEKMQKNLASLKEALCS